MANFELPKFESTLKGNSPTAPAFTMQNAPNVDTGPAQTALAQQAAQAKQNQQSQENILHTVKMASDLAQAFVEMSKQRQQNDAIKAYAALQPNKTLAGVLRAFPEETAKQAIDANYPKTFQGMAVNQLNQGQPVNPEIAPTAQSLNKPAANPIVTKDLKDPVDGKTYTYRVNPDNSMVKLGLAKELSGTMTADAKLEVSRRNEVDKAAKATDPVNLRDYDRLGAAKRLSAFVESTGGKAIGMQVREASTMLASMLTGGGRGSVVSEKLIEQLTPRTLKGTAMEKVQWLKNHPESVDQGKFIEIMKNTSDREAKVAEDNIRQQQVQEIRKRKGNFKDEDYKRILTSAGLTEDNIDPKTGEFKRTPGMRSILPDFDPYKIQANKPIDALAGLLKLKKKGS